MKGDPEKCLICFKTLKHVRLHMKRMHKALLGYDAIDKEWCYIHY